MKKVLFILLVFGGLLGESHSQTPSVNVVADSLDTPWEILWGPDNHIWITERKGVVSRVDPKTGKVKEVQKIAEVTEQSEAGLMGMALHPDFPDSPYVYLAYNYLVSTNLKVRIARYRYLNNSLSSPKTLLQGIDGSSIHDGARIAVGPDRMLYITTGDAGNTNLPQNDASLNGKVLRMGLDGSVPADNPIPGSYLWTKGHRNAQGLVFGNGILYSSEHGPSSDDEINIISKDRNYGWPNVMGFCNTPSEAQFCMDSNVVEPIRAWTPTLAVAGLDFYDNNHFPDWKNSLLLTSLKAGKFLRLELNLSGDSIINEETIFDNTYGRLRDVCISPDGKVYIATSNRDGRGNPVSSDDRIIELYNPSVGMGQAQLKTVRIYPNPARGYFSIQTGNERIHGVRVMDMSGKELLEGRFLPGNKIDISHLEKGIYIVELNSDGNTHFQRLLIN